MITGAPLPSWAELAALLSGGADGGLAASPWASPTDKVVWFSRSAYSLAAIAASWQRRHGRLPRLWVPDYFCNASLDPVRRAGVPLTFYPIGLNLAPDWEECHRLVLAEAPDLFLAVHYFGLPADMAAALEFCRQEGALLIEDCAHVLAPVPGVGENGTFVLWSPHKHLAVPQGGLLVCRDIDSTATALPGPAPSIRPWLVKRLVQKLAPGWLLPPATCQGPQAFSDDPAVQGLLSTPALADSGLRMLALAARALPQIVATRRRNAKALLDILTQEPGWRPLFDPTTVNPYRLVMACDLPRIAEDRFVAYRRTGLPVESWPDLAPEIKAAPERHAGALTLRACLVCFPIHHSLDKGELVRRAEKRFMALGALTSS